MRIGEVIGKVTLSKQHASLQGARWLIAVPLTVDQEDNTLTEREEPFVVFDELSAATGLQIAISEGAEAAAPFHPDTKPIDAYAAAILDQIELVS